MIRSFATFLVGISVAFASALALPSASASPQTTSAPAEERRSTTFEPAHATDLDASIIHGTGQPDDLDDETLHDLDF